MRTNQFDLTQFHLKCENIVLCLLILPWIVICNKFQYIPETKELGLVLVYKFQDYKYFNYNYINNLLSKSNIILKLNKYNEIIINEIYPLLA